MNPVWVVVEFEPAIRELGPPESKLTAWDQMNEVWGPFDAEREADEWIDRRKAWLDRSRGSTPRHFSITQTTVPFSEAQIDEMYLQGRSS